MFILVSVCPIGDFPKPNRGTFSPDNNYDGFETNKEVTITCKYAAKEGPDEVQSTCKSDEMWQPNLPECVGKTWRSWEVLRISWNY